MVTTTGKTFKEPSSAARQAAPFESIIAHQLLTTTCIANVPSILGDDHQLLPQYMSSAPTIGSNATLLPHYPHKPSPLANFPSKIGMHDIPLRLIVTFTS